MRGLINSSLNWFSRRIGRPRLWSKKEWNASSSKEKIWVWYKHHLYLKGLGSAEIDQVSDPVKEIILYGSIIILTVERLYAMAGITVGAEQLLVTVGVVCIAFWISNTIMQWIIGNKIDNLDLPACGEEINIRRNKLFREIRERAENEEWRKNAK